MEGCSLSLGIYCMVFTWHIAGLSFFNFTVAHVLCMFGVGLRSVCVRRLAGGGAGGRAAQVGLPAV
jgi:hypothetical protein